MRQLDGSGSGFGQRFWALIGQEGFGGALPANKSVVSVAYEDRYLVTPISCALLVEVVTALKSVYERSDGWDNPSITISSMYIDERREFRHRDHWTSDWQRTDLRDAALRAAFEFCGMTASVNSRYKNDVSHGRRLVVRFNDGTGVTVWLDQGLSYWTVSRQQSRTAVAVFTMDDDIEILGARLAEIKIGIEGHELPTQLFVDQRAS